MVTYKLSQRPASFLDGSDLNKDVCTIPIFVNYSLQTANLTFDSTQPFLICLFKSSGLPQTPYVAIDQYDEVTHSSLCARLDG